MGSDLKSACELSHALARESWLFDQLGAAQLMTQSEPVITQVAGVSGTKLLEAEL